MAQFARHFGKSPDQLGPEEIRAYQVALVERRVAWSLFNQSVCALRFLYRHTLGQDWAVEPIPFPRQAKKLPVVLSLAEVAPFFPAIRSLKPRAMLMTAYATGLRLSEVTARRVPDIDSPRRRILVRQGKGRQARSVMLSPRLLAVLREDLAGRPARRLALPRALPGPPDQRQRGPAGRSGGAPGFGRRHGRDRPGLAPQLRHPPARAGDRRPAHPDPAGPPEPPDHRPRPPPLRPPHRRHPEPLRPAAEPGSTGRGRMPRPALEVAEIFRRHGPAYRAAQGAALSRAPRRVMAASEAGRPAALGGPGEEGDQGGHRTIASEDRGREPAPTRAGTGPAPSAGPWPRPRGSRPARPNSCPWRSFHGVFTGPESLGALALQNKRAVYTLLFHAAAETLRRIAADPKPLGAEIGFLAGLHTWGQTLLHHPHLHCVVPGGGLSPDGQRWVPGRPGFFLPVRVLSRVFRRLFLHPLQGAFDRGELQFHGPLASLADRHAFARLLAPARTTAWEVYATPPFGGPAQVLDSLGRSTPRGALADHRWLALEDGKVTFRLKDYRQEHRLTTLTREAAEFIRRVLLHVWPDGFVRIRHSGFLSNRPRAAKLAECRQWLGVPDAPAPVPPPQAWTARYEALTGQPVDRCPACRQGRLRRVETLPPLAPLPPPPPPELDSS